MEVLTEVDMDQIFASFCEDRQSSAPRPLVSWISEHPGLQGLFVQWAADVPALETADLGPAVPEFEAKSLRIGEALLRKFNLASEEPETLTSLHEAARRCGASPRQLAQRLGVGMTVVAKLNRRLIRAASIPMQLIESLAAELQVTVQQVQAYLAQPATLAQGAAYRSDQAPEVAHVEEFDAAVRNSPDMTAEQKQDWLA